MGNGWAQPYNVAQSFGRYGGQTEDRHYRWLMYVRDLITCYNKVKVHKLGFFRENLNLNEAYQETEVETHDSWKIKTPGSYCYRIKINIPNSRYHTFR